MSMLSIQIDRLRDRAQQFEGYQNGEISRMLRDAAYTIESLRDRLQAATLGSGTCRNVHKEWEKSSFAGACTSFCCSECGAHYVDGECYYAGLADADEEQIRTNYCPNCGAKVIEEVDNADE